MTLEARDISFGYGAQPVLNRVSLSVETSRVTALFGPNGTGKSTLFKCILGLLPHTGAVSVDGTATARWSARRTAQHLAFVPQDHASTFPHSVRDMVTMGTAARGGSLLGPTPAGIERALNCLDQLGLLKLSERSFPSLSGGQRQLVLIARGLAQDTPYLLFDEPTASLDFGNQNLIWNTMRDLAHQHGKGILVCSHDPNHVLWFCDDAVVLSREGTAKRSGQVSDVVTEATLRSLYADGPHLVEAGGVPIVLPGQVTA